MSASPDELESERCVACLQRGLTTYTTHAADGEPMCEDCHRQRELEKVAHIAHAMDDVDWHVVPGISNTEAATFCHKLAGPDAQ